MGDELFSWLASGTRTEALKALRPKINELLKDQMHQVKQLVREHAGFVHAIAGELLQRGDLTGEEIEEIYERLYGRTRPEPPQIRSGLFDRSLPQADLTMEETAAAPEDEE